MSLGNKSDSRRVMLACIGIIGIALIFLAAFSNAVNGFSGGSSTTTINNTTIQSTTISSVTSVFDTTQITSQTTTIISSVSILGYNPCQVIINGSTYESICNNKVKYSGSNFSLVTQDTINDTTVCPNYFCQVNFGNGTFMVGNYNLVPKNNLVLNGLGKYITTFELLPGIARHILFDNVGGLLNFTVTNIGFNGNKNHQTDPTGTLARVNGELVLIAGRGNQFVYFENDLCQLGRTGACFDLTSTNLRLEDSLIQNNGVSSASIASDNVHLGGGNITSNAIISNNKIANCTDTNLAIDNVKSSTITGNILSGCMGADMTIDENSSGDTITGNTLNETKYVGAWLIAQQVQGTGAFNITFTGNTLISKNQSTSSNKFLFFVKNCNTWTITGNTFVGSLKNTNDFLVDFVLDSYFTFSNNVLYAPFASANVISDVFLNGITNFTIVGNTIAGGKMGIQFATNTASAGLITGNSFIGVNLVLQYANHLPTSVVIKNNQGYNPVGVKTFVNATGTIFAPYGTTNTLVASTTYKVDVTDIFLSCSGGTSVTYTIADQNGVTISAGLTALTNTLIPVGWELKTDAFVLAPTCVGAFN